MIKVLVVGGEGYIGSHLIREMVSRGFNQIHSIDMGVYRDDPNLPFHRSSQSHEINHNAHFDSLSENQICFWKSTFTSLGKGFIEHHDFDAIIWLAGHSSVKMCENHQTDVIFNNVTSLESFMIMYNQLVKKPLLIYASSASVYGDTTDINGIGRNATEDSMCQSLSPYDLSMLHRDRMMTKYMTDKSRIIGLRFGTVCGHSPVQRTELMVNNMAKTALTDKRIYISNPKTRRAILYNRDLSSVIIKLVSLYSRKQYDGMIDDNKLSGIYNLSSVNNTVGDLGDHVLQIVRDYDRSLRDVKIEEFEAPPSNYSFYMDTTKISRLVGRSTFRSNPIEAMVLDLLHGYPYNDRIMNEHNNEYFCTEGTRDEYIDFSKGV